MRECEKSVGGSNEATERRHPRIHRRSERRRVRESRVKKWAARSVWSEVCAKELGLIIESVSLSDDLSKGSGGTRKKFRTSRKVEQTSRFYGPVKKNWIQNARIRETGFPAREFSKTRVYVEHPYALPSSSSFPGKIESPPRRNTIYNNFNTPCHNSKHPFTGNRECRNGKENSSRKLNELPKQKYFSPLDRLALKPVAIKKRKVEEPVASAAKKEKKQPGKYGAGSKLRQNQGTSLPPRVDNGKKGKIPVKLNRAKLPREKDDPGISHGKKSSAKSSGRKPTSGRRKTLEYSGVAVSTVETSQTFDKTILKNDYENSDMDESLLVDPSTDLPQCLLDTIESDIQLGELEFDVGRDLNLHTDAPVSSNFPSLDRELLSSPGKPDALAISRKTVKRTTRDFSRVRRTANKAAALGTRRREKRNGTETTVNRIRTDEAKAREEAPPVRVTRLSTKNSLSREKKEGSREIGTIVWGNCTGWWPAFIVDCTDVGMSSMPDKAWVCWIGEYKISHLREKTQIRSFSSCLRERLIKTLRSSNRRDPTYVACLATIELISDYVSNVEPLSEPYHFWVEKNLTNLENIDRLVLSPYPPSIQLRLDELKKSNESATEKHASWLKTEAGKASMAKTSASGKPVATKKGVVAPQGHLPLMKQRPGVIAWAKIMGQPWWPAVIVDYRDLSVREPSFGCQWIVWYGDWTMSQVNHRFFLSFENGITLMKEYIKNCKRECFRRGVIDAAKDHCSRYGYRTEHWRIDDVLAWFESNDVENVIDEYSASPREDAPRGNNLLPGIPGNPSNSLQKYPAGVIQALRNRAGDRTVAAAREHAILDNGTLSELDSGGTSVEQLCLMCLKKDEDENDEGTEHPFFFGRLCGDCLKKYEPTIFAYGDDGKCFFCTVCAGSDTVVMCDVDDCPRVYCTACIKYLIAPNFYDDVMLKDPWFCFVCDDSDGFLRDGSLKPRSDWRDRVARLFRSNNDSMPRHVERCANEKKRPIRVLSLFDGISAGLVVLKKLGIRVEVYYASEIDPDAEMVSSAHHGSEIKRLGDVRSITEEKIREIVPIDLLIGGSPCNDLSLVNPLRLGLRDPNGTGVLFFEYCRIKNILERYNADRHLFWLFENVASMPSKYRLEINEHLGREPDLIDSANYSPQHRPRLYWNNLPTVSFPLSSQDLQDVLTPNCNRHALVKKIRTVTTRVNSLKQGKEALKPILMNETNDTLWITELEEIFGFPRHYTDVKNLCATKRQKLIAVSWSVQTIVEIMRPLCNFFRTRNDASS